MASNYPDRAMEMQWGVADTDAQWLLESPIPRRHSSGDRHALLPAPQPGIT
jgi:hypothetical protein